MNNPLKKITRLFSNYIYFARELLAGKDPAVRSVAEKQRELLQGFESFGIISLGAGLFFLAGLENYQLIHTGKDSFWLIMLLFPLLSLIYSLTIRKTDFLHTVATLFYLLYFFSIYYYPDLLRLTLSDRTEQANYLLHLVFVFSQAIRPGRFPGVPVVLIVIGHYLLTLFFSHQIQSLSIQHILYIAFMIWSAFITIFQETVIYFNLVTQLETKLKNRYNEAEMTLAKNVYNHLFPGFRKNKNIHLHTHHTSRNEAGGDFYDVVFLREGNLGFFLTDISGHGISSAMMSAAVKGIVTSIPFHKRMSPSRFLTHMDYVISHEYGSHHATAVYLYIDFHQRKMRYANAGHPPILFSRAGEPFTELESSGSILGFGIQTPIAREYEIHFSPGDRVMIFTDGLLDFSGLQENQLETTQTPLPLMTGLENIQSEDLIDTLLDRIKRLPEFAEFTDDVMIVLLDLLPHAES